VSGAPTSEIEERIHRALSKHPLERIEHGYRLVHEGMAGVSILRLLPVGTAARGGAPAATPVVAGSDAPRPVAVAEILAEHSAEGLPAFHAAGVQRLNAMAVHGAFELKNGRLRQTARLSIHAHEAQAPLAAQLILNAFGAQLPLGRSLALATVSAAVLEQQRAHHAMPLAWTRPLPEPTLADAARLLRERGLAASHNDVALWAELPLSGDCPSRSIDPGADTAILQVNVGTPHPIAGAGYLTTISLPGKQSPEQGAALCARLNVLELRETDLPPQLGAWGLHGPEGHLGYSCFIPAPRPLADLHLTLMWWCIRRAAWIRDRFWRAHRGLELAG
jgi:hypothetical protein